MQKFARLTPGRNIEFVDMTRPNSNFDFIEKRFGGLDTLRRLFSQIRQHGGRTIVLEELPLSKDIAEENQDLIILRPAFSPGRVVRLGFFDRPLLTNADLSSVGLTEILGYTILKEDIFGSDHETRVYESVIRHSNHPHNFIKNEPDWDLRIGGQPFKIRGHIYAQQNGITNCCAHVALRTAIGSFPLREISYRRMNRLAGIDLKKRSPGAGLDTTEMVRILEKAGARCFVADYRIVTIGGPPPPFQKYVYGSIESGYPAIISFETTSNPGDYHALPTFGHTFNSDTWVPSAERSYFQIGSGTRYIPSESWVSMYIGHDDNWGSNYCIPRHYFQTQHPTSPTTSSTPTPFSGECVAHVISTMPREVKISPIRAEAIGVDYLSALQPQLIKLHNNTWAKRLTDYASRNLLVFRPLLVTPQQYAKHLSRVRDWKGKKIRVDMIDAINQSPSEKLWMIEISVPHLFSANFRKVGELVIRAEKKLGASRDLSGFFLARLPGYFAVYDGGGPINPRFNFGSSGATEHVELFGCEEKT